MEIEEIGGARTLSQMMIETGGKGVSGRYEVILVNEKLGDQAIKGIRGFLRHLTLCIGQTRLMKHFVEALLTGQGAKAPSLYDL